MSFEEFIHMNGFGFYIWTSYAITAFTCIGLFVMFRIQHKQLIKQLRKRYGQEARQKQNS